MVNRKAYSNIMSKGCMRTHALTILTPAILFLTVFFNGTIYSQDLPEYDEIGVFLELQGYGGSEMEALIKDEKLYLPITGLFNFLKIKNEPSAGLDEITGFFVNQDATYEIDRMENRIVYQGKTISLGKGDLIRTETNLYLLADYFGKVFGLDCKFNFRALSVNVSSRLELPVIREMKQEEMRKNLSRLKGDYVADTTIGRTYPLFKFGMADWSVYSFQETDGNTDTRLNLALGSMIAGGEATASLYYNTSEPFNEKLQQYQWRYVNNDFAPLRQIIAGKVQTGAVSSLYNPVIGVQLTNTPTTYRRSFGSYVLSDRTEPGWIVELYVNNVLVDFAKADPSGFFTFNVPLVYGNSIVKLRFFGPWGEERTREQNIVIPYNFLPEKTLEYTVSAGIVEDTLASRFTRASFNYGVSKSLTVGAGAEYLSSVTDQPFMPFVNASYKVTNNLLLFGEYVMGVRSKGTLSYRLPSNMQLDLNYTWYDKEQKAILYNYREERKASLTIPLKIGKTTAFNRFSLNQIVLPVSKYTTGEWMISGSVMGINANLTTYAVFLDEVDPYIYSNLSLGYRLPGGFVVMPQVQYSFTENELLSAKARVEKAVFKHGFANISYEQNFRNNLRLAEAGLRYDFSFAQAGASVRQYDKKTSFIQYARGSIINDRKTKYTRGDNRTNVGRGGITVIAFLDVNSNGKRDPGEQKVPGLNLHASGGRVEMNDKDTTVRVLNLEPYTNCFIELDQNSFDNIAWRLKKKSYSVAVDPNILKTIEVAVSISGEATGYVYLEKENIRNGLGKILVNFLDNNNKKAGSTMSEDDGYFSIFNLTPGNYRAFIDTMQMKKLGMRSDPQFVPFMIKGMIDGDIAEGIDFVLTRIYVDTVRTIADTTRPAAELPVVVPAVKDSLKIIIHELTEVVYTLEEDSWAIQIGAFRSKSYAEGFKKMLEKELGKEVQITVAGDYYRVRILDLHTRAEVDQNVAKLNKLGFKELWIIRLLALQQQTLLVTKADTVAIAGKDALTEAERDALRLDAFRLRTEASALLKGLPASLNEKGKVEIRGRYYRLETPDQPLIDPEVLEAMEEMNTDLVKVETKDEWTARVKNNALMGPEGPVEKEMITVTKAIVRPYRSIQVIDKQSVSLSTSELAPAEPPSIALQVAIYHRETQAMRARKKIMEKLNLPVVVVKQWEYYHVLVIGFTSRDETAQYYPELAGLGYPGITLIENFRPPKE